MTCHSVGNFIIPTDFHIFQRGRYTHQPDDDYFPGTWSQCRTEMAAETTDPPSCPRKCGKCHPGNPRETAAWQKDIRKDKTKDKRETRTQNFSEGMEGTHLGHILDTKKT